MLHWEGIVLKRVSVESCLLDHDRAQGRIRQNQIQLFMGGVFILLEALPFKLHISLGGLPYVQVLKHVHCCLFSAQKGIFIITFMLTILYQTSWKNMESLYKSYPQKSIESPLTISSRYPPQVKKLTVVWYPTLCC